MQIATLTANDMFEKFLRLSVAQGSACPRTLRSYRDGISCYFKWCEGAIDPLTATYEDIEVYRSYLCSTYSKKTCALKMTTVRILYKALQRWGARKDNPADGVKSPIDRTTDTDKALAKALSLDEVEKLIFCFHAPISCLGIRDKAMISLMLYQGLRASEVLSLQEGAVDTVSWSSIRIHGKGGKERTLVLCSEAREALRSWMGHRQIYFTKDTPVFYRLDSTYPLPLNIKTLERVVNKYLEAIGARRKGRSCHSLRHTYGVLAVLGGADREALADSFGHSDTKTTDIYIRAAGRLQNNPADSIGKAIEKNANLRKNASLTTEKMNFMGTEIEAGKPGQVIELPRT